MNLANTSTTETTIATTEWTSRALTAGAGNHDSDDVVVLEGRTRQRRKEKEIGKRKEEIARLRAEIFGRRPSAASNVARRAAAAGAAAFQVLFYILCTTVPKHPSTPSTSLHYE